jgi:hypothetical protein
LNSSHLSAEPCQDCPGPISTIPGTVKCNPDWGPQWDRENSAKQFPSGEPPVNVYVTEGQGPYTWAVSNGFTLECTDECATSNTVSSLGTDCIATITVTDRCGNQTTGSVRRPGYWDAELCYRYKLPTCNNHGCNSAPKQVDLVDHKVEFSCCGYRGLPELTGRCDDGFDYTVSIHDCNLSGFCYDDYDPGIFSLYIRKWVCY